MKKRAHPDKDKEGKGCDRGAKGNKGEDTAKLSESSALDEESENQGFGTWLRSSDGVEMMRLFVIANSLLVFVTMAWPNMQEALYILKEYITGEEEDE